MTARFIAWQKKFTALKEYWNNMENNFALPCSYNDPSSGLNYKFYKQYVINVAKVKKEVLKKDLKKAIAVAKAKRTTRINQVCQKIDNEHKCKYMKNQKLVSKCKNWAKYDKLTRCRYHKKLSYGELEKLGTHQLFKDGRARAYSSTCLIKTSTIQGAGNGVFATRHFYPEDPITIYAFSRIITAAEHESLKGKREYDYVLMLRGNRQHCFLGLTDPVVGLGLGSFVNAPHQGKEFNCKYKFTKPDNRTIAFLSFPLECFPLILKPGAYSFLHLFLAHSGRMEVCYTREALQNSRIQ